MTLSNTSRDTPKIKKLEGSWMCAQHQLLRVRAGGHPLVTLWLAGRCYKNCRTFFSLVPGGKEKIYFQNLHLWLFEIGVWNRSVKQVISIKSIQKLQWQQFQTLVTDISSRGRYFCPPDMFICQQLTK